TARRAQAERVRASIATDPASWRDVARTLNTGRSQMIVRAACLAGSPDELASQLAAVASGASAPRVHVGRASSRDAVTVAMVCTGQGAQYVGMGRELFELVPVFRDTLERCDEILRPLIDRPLLSVLYPADGASPIDETAYAQPALFAVDYALVQVWKSLGIEPLALAGHSLGEYVAACAAGVFSLEDGLRL